MTYVVSTLLCHKDLPTGIRCLSSLVAASADHISLQILDDGTLSHQDGALLRNALPESKILWADDRSGLINETLRYYPRLQTFRHDNPLGKKLIDLALFSSGDTIRYCDSDVYFRRRFSGLWNATDTAVFLRDQGSAYSLSPIHAALNGSHPLPGRLNTGVIVFPKAAVDLEYLESLLNTRSIRSSLERVPCWAEQTLWAFLAGSTKTSFIAAKQSWIVNEAPLESIPESNVLIHFVSSYRTRLSELPPGLPQAPAQKIEFEESIPLRRFELLSQAIQRKWSVIRPGLK